MEASMSKDKQGQDDMLQDNQNDMAEQNPSRRRVISAGALGIAASTLAGTSLLKGAEAMAQSTPAAPAKPAQSTGSEITYRSGDVNIKGYLARPAGTVQSNGAAIIVIHE